MLMAATSIGELVGGSPKTLGLDTLFDYLISSMDKKIR